MEFIPVSHPFLSPLAILPITMRVILLLGPFLSRSPPTCAGRRRVREVRKIVMVLTKKKKAKLIFVKKNKYHTCNYLKMILAICWEKWGAHLEFPLIKVLTEELFTS